MSEEIKAVTVRLHFISGKQKNLFNICVVKGTDSFVYFIDTEQVEFAANIDQILSYEVIPDEEEE